MLKNPEEGLALLSYYQMVFPYADVVYPHRAKMRDSGIHKRFAQSVERNAATQEALMKYMDLTFSSSSPPGREAFTLLELLAHPIVSDETLRTMWEGCGLKGREGFIGHFFFYSYNPLFLKWMFLLARLPEGEANEIFKDLNPQLVASFCKCMFGDSDEDSACTACLHLEDFLLLEERFNDSKKMVTKCLYVVVFLLQGHQSQQSSTLDFLLKLCIEGWHEAWKDWLVAKKEKGEWRMDAISEDAQKLFADEHLRPPKAFLQFRKKLPREKCSSKD